MTLLELSATIVGLVEQARKMPSSRELALAITKLQEAYLWITERLEVEGGHK